MAFLDKAGLQTLTNKLVQGDAIKVASSRGYTVKNVIDNITRECSDVENPQTMALEDETGHFIVGKGKDIDVSGDIEAGKLAFGFKGKTLQNLIPTPIDFSKWTKNRGDIVFEEGRVRIDGTSRWNSLAEVVFNWENSTTYTLFCRYKCGGENFKELRLTKGDTHLEPMLVETESVDEFKEHKIVFTTSSSATQRYHWFDIYAIPKEENSPGYWVEVKDLVLLKGDHSDREYPKLFEGIKSSFETEEERKIIHTGKNLWSEGDLIRVDRYNKTFSQPILRKGITYTLSFSKIQPLFKIRTGEFFTFRFAEKNMDYTVNSLQIAYTNATSSKAITFTPKKDCYHLSIYTRGASWGESNGFFANVENFQIEEGRGVTEYAPYIKEKRTIELEEPLRSLPYGVCDESTEDGRLIRRIGVRSLADIKNWNSWRAEYVHSDMIGAYSESFKDIKTDYSLERSPSLFCDKLSVGARGELSTRNISFVCRGGYYIGVAVRKDQLETPNQEGLIKWIKKNDPVVYYETTERIASVAKTLFSTSQHSKIEISSAIAPITTYKVPLNRAAQIDNSIKTIQELKQRIELLEQAYDNHFLESQYKLSLLKLEHQIESEEI